MSELREEILANFQGITGIDDVAEAILHLDEADWNLLLAINLVMPQDVSNASHRQNSMLNNSEVDVEMIDDDISVIKTKFTAPARPMEGMSVIHGPSTSCKIDRPIRILEFRVHYLDTQHNFEMADTENIGDLRRKICDLSGIAPCRQVLDGLRCPMPLPNTILSSLCLADKCEIFMKVPDEQQFDDRSAERVTQMYTLNIDNEDKLLKLQFPGTRTILQIKGDIYTLTNIPVRHQVWTGWPDSPNLDETMLALSGVSYPVHNLKVKKVVPKPITVHNDSDSEESSVGEFEDAETFAVEDDIFLDNVRTKKEDPLIPDNVDDETIGCIQFSERFQERYGPLHPLFFQGSLDNAIKEACMKPAKDRRLLGIYLHHEASVLSNVFCAQLLGCESVLQVLAANFVVYGWDLTFESNKNMLLSSVSNTLGGVASMTVKNIPLDRLPVLIIIMRIRSNTEIFSVINGNVTLEELLGQLVEGVERWAGRRDDEIQEEQQRAALQQLKWEQDEAYRQSLEADRAKEELKKMIEKAETEERLRIESERQEAEAKREAIRQGALSRLPEEPPADSSDSITKIRIRLPEGNFLERRFTTNTMLKILLDYLTVEGYPADEYKIISNWPRRDLTTIDGESTLLALKLCPQETVMLEKRSSE